MDGVAFDRIGASPGVSGSCGGLLDDAGNVGKFYRLDLPLFSKSNRRSDI